MTEKHIKKYWENWSSGYQEECKIPIGIHYGPGAPYEDKLKLLGNLKGKEVLELACGGAQCGIAMAKKGAKVTGMDISKEQLKFAKELADKNKVKIKLIQSSFQDLEKIKSNSKDIVFTAFGLQYSTSLLKVFKQVYRILKRNGIFVFSLDHPFFRVISPKTLKVRESYFKTGRYVEKNPDVDFVGYNHTISELFNPLVEAGFKVEKIVEPDSRKKYKKDSWYNLWDLYTPKMLRMIPPTIIFKARKLR